MKLLLLLTLLISIFLSCSSEEPRQVNKEEAPVAPRISSCSFNPLDGECTYYSDKSVLCSMGSCTLGDCTTGKGTLTYPSGTTLETTFKKGKIEGSLSLNQCGNGVQFVGILKDYARKGKHTYPNGETYEGTIIDNKKEGKGIFVDKAGNIYEGSWKNDIRDGKFTIKDFESKSKSTVTYINGKDDEERERERQYAIDRKRKEEAERAQNRISAAESSVWHNRLLTCSSAFTSRGSKCDGNYPIVFKSTSIKEYVRICDKTYARQYVSFRCKTQSQIIGPSQQDETSVTYYDQFGNCVHPDDLCDR